MFLSLSAFADGLARNRETPMVEPHESAPSPTDAAARARTVSFFETLFGSLDNWPPALGARIVISPLSRGKPCESTWASSPELAAEAVLAACRRREDVYFQVALHSLARRAASLDAASARDLQSASPSTSCWKRGTIPSAVAIPGLWLDVDYGQRGHAKGELPPDVETARELVDRIAAVVGAASLVVHTGGGLHVYYQFREPWFFDTDPERTQALALSRAFGRFAARVAAQLGMERTGQPYQLDAVYDLARVLRVPGTWNFKLAEPRPVAIERESATRYNPDDLLEHPAIAPFLAEEAPARATVAIDVDRQQVKDPALVARVRQRVEALLATDRTFAALWNHELDDDIAAEQRERGRGIDTSFSTYDLRIAMAASALRWTPEELVALLHEHYRVRGRDPAAKASSYYERTVAKAIEATRRVRDGRPAPPAPRPTRAIVRDAKEAQAVIGEIADSWSPGSQSLAVATFPGVGKTTAFTKRLIHGLARRDVGFESGIAVLVEPNRELVAEKQAAAVALAEGGGVSVDVRDFLGRSPSPDGPWWCEQFESFRLAAELGRSHCASCIAKEPCRSRDGRYLKNRTALMTAFERARDQTGPPVFLVTTPQALEVLLPDLPSAVPIVIDDTGPTFGLVQHVPLRLADVQAAADQAHAFLDDRLAEGTVSIEGLLHERERWEARAKARDEALAAWNEALDRGADRGACMAVLGDVCPPAGINAFEARRVLQQHWAKGRDAVATALARLARADDNLHVVLAASLITRVLESILTVRTRRLEPVHLHDALKRALLQGHVRAPEGPDGRSWPWEEPQPHDGSDGRPRFADLAVRIATEHVRGHSPVISRAPRESRASGAPEFTVVLPHEELVRRARLGCVAWLGVGAMPQQVVDALGARREVVHASPHGLRVLLPLFVARKSRGGRTTYLTFGKRPAAQSHVDRAALITQDLCRQLHATRGDSLVAVVRREDFEALGQPKWATYYGRGHAATDRYRDARTLVLRRFVPPFRAIALEADALRAALRLPPVSNSDATVPEARSWAASGPEVVTRSLADPLARELQRFHEQHAMLNALGRCRPLSNTEVGRLVVVLTSIPFDGVTVHAAPAEEILQALGVALDEARLRDRAAQALDEFNERRAIVVTEQMAEIAVILESGEGSSDRGIARRLKVSDRTIRRRIHDLRELGGVSLPDTRCIRFLIKRVATSDTPRHGLPLPAAVKAWIEAHGRPAPSRSTLNRILNDLAAGIARTPPGMPVVMPARRSDQLRNYVDVLEAVAELQANRADAVGAGEMLVQVPMPAQVAAGARTVGESREPIADATEADGHREEVARAS